jgi:hypothetical protein
LPKKSPPIILTNRAWIHESQISSDLMDPFIYKQKVRKPVDSDEDLEDLEEGAWRPREWEEVEEDVILPVYNEKKTHVGLPRGNLQKIRRLLPKSRIVDRRAIPPLDFDLNVHDYVFEDERWDNQKDLVDKWLKAGGGVIKSPAASGKSVLSIVIMARMGLRTLCLFDRKDFRKQWLQELHKHTNIQDLEKEMGRTLAGIFTGQELFPITFSTFQQMLSQRSQKLILDNRDYFGLIVVDEVHHAAAPAFRSRISLFNPLTYLGVSATPFRKDKLEQIYFDHLGPIVADSSSEQIPPIVTLVDTGFNVEPRPSMPDWQKFNNFISQIARNTDRNNLICKLVLKDLKKGRCVLVVSDRVKHCHDLRDRLCNRNHGYDKARQR